ncbi:MAG: hypothetical protein A2X49_12060 [Lentisphaerae bacterium GWF2_52_8]|nr:MAG: hypothetical protein A2X49_12060 [Lentisphaerae bacterium GWF2_52_8]
MSENIDPAKSQKPLAEQGGGNGMARVYVWAAVIIVTVSILSLSAYAIFSRLIDLPRSAAAQLGQAISGAVNVNLTQDFQSFVEKKEKRQSLVLCSVSRVEMQARRFSFDVKGKELSSAILEICSPVTYYYCIDMRGKWELHNKGGELLVIAPRLQALEPAINMEQMKTSIDSGKLIFNEEGKMEKFKKEFLEILRKKSASPEYLDQVRSEARASLAEFINSWVVKSMPDGDSVKSISVRFEDEKDFPFLSYYVKRM